MESCTKLFGINPLRFFRFRSLQQPEQYSPSTTRRILVLDTPLIVCNRNAKTCGRVSMLAAEKSVRNQGSDACFLLPRHMIAFGPTEAALNNRDYTKRRRAETVTLKVHTQQKSLKTNHSFKASH